MNFDKYKPEEFLQEQSFLNYCLARNEEDTRFWESWRHANPQKEEDVQQAVELYFLLNGSVTKQQYKEDEQLFQAELQQYKEELNIEPAISGRRNYWWWYGAAAAAAVIVAILLISPRYSVNTGKIPGFTERSKPGERRPVQLPDGSSVVLNSGSTLAVADNYNATSRELTLTGEAFFTVNHNVQKPFIVHTRHMDIKVLGTVFNIKAYDEEEHSETSLLEGSVEVTLLHEDGRKLILAPNEKIVYSIARDSNMRSRGGYTALPLKRSAAKEVDEVSWTKNRINFADQSFGEISTTLERWFAVKIVFDDPSVRQYRFTATFENKTIDEVLDALKLSRQFSYQMKNDTIYIGK